MRQFGQRFFVGGIDHGFRLAALAVVPLAADEKSKLGVHRVPRHVMSGFGGTLCHFALCVTPREAHGRVATPPKTHAPLPPPPRGAGVLLISRALEGRAGRRELPVRTVSCEKQKAGEVFRSGRSYRRRPARDCFRLVPHDPGRSTSYLPLRTSEAAACFYPHGRDPGSEVNVARGLRAGIMRLDRRAHDGVRALTANRRPFPPSSSPLESALRERVDWNIVLFVEMSSSAKGLFRELPPERNAARRV